MVKWPVEDIPAEVAQIKKEMLADGLVLSEDMEKMLEFSIFAGNGAFYAGYSAGCADTRRLEQFNCAKKS